MSPFAKILQTAVESTPGAVGGAFAAPDGETVDHFSSLERSEWAILTAHYGIVLRHVQKALNTLHYGEASSLHLSHTSMEIVIYVVAEGYFALLALEAPAPLAHAHASLAAAATELRREMM